MTETLQQKCEIQMHSLQLLQQYSSDLLPYFAVQLFTSAEIDANTEAATVTEMAKCYLQVNFCGS